MMEHTVGTREGFDVSPRRARGRRVPLVNALRTGTRTTVLLVGAAVATWVLTVERMRGMDAGPGTDLGGLGWYLGTWLTMTVAMMLPSAAPAEEHVARLARRFPTLLFVAGYLAVWTAYGLAAYGLFRLLTSFDTGWLARDAGGSYVAGGVMVAVGIYELTPLKQLSLRRCRSPEHPTSAVGSSLAHGIDCVGCSGGLMIVLFVLGVMSLLWMALVAAVIFVEKVLPYGPLLSRVFAVALVALGIWVAASPGSVPGLIEPDGSRPRWR
jgi:predicted metal-binding membrane protein